MSGVTETYGTAREPAPKGERGDQLASVIDAAIRHQVEAEVKEALDAVVGRISPSIQGVGDALSPVYCPPGMNTTLGDGLIALLALSRLVHPGTISQLHSQLEKAIDKEAKERRRTWARKVAWEHSRVLRGLREPVHETEQGDEPAAAAEEDSDA